MYPCEENITENIRKIILSSCMYISVDEDWKMCSSCCWLHLSVFSRQPSESNRSECNTGKSAFISRMSKLCRTQKHLPCRLVMNYKINMMQDYLISNLHWYCNLFCKASAASEEFQAECNDDRILQTCLQCQKIS